MNKIDKIFLDEASKISDDKFENAYINTSLSYISNYIRNLTEDDLKKFRTNDEHKQKKTTTHRIKLIGHWKH